METSSASLLSVMTSSLEKCFVDGNIADYPRVRKLSGFQNERLCFTLALSESSAAFGARRVLRYRLRSSLKKFVSVSRIESVPCRMPVYPGLFEKDGNYLRKEPGLYPDVLVPAHEGEIISVPVGQICSLWIDVNAGLDTMPAGEHPIEIILLSDNGEQIKTEKITLRIIPALLPESDMAVTQWFHCDSLAAYYNVRPFSEKHWRIIRNYIKTAVKNGINTILTPVFTPPLDTEPGGERMTVQLVGVKCSSDPAEGGAEYEFDFSLLGRWIDMCLDCGVEYFEISHFFTQWGALHAPKIVAGFTSGGKTVSKRIFGWDTDAHGDEYGRFLRAFLSALIPYLKSRGVDKKCVYHISDEPSANDLDNYIKSKAQLGGLLDGYTIIDALSNYTFYESGAVKTPVPANDHIKPFIEGGVKNLWTYYCCGQNYRVSNRFIDMPSARNRIIGTQFYKYDIAGFLQWGYNFYFTHLSRRPVNPFQVTDGDFWVPSGDAFSVYPASDGTTLESVRLAVFQNALQDMRAMKLLGTFVGKDKVIGLIEEGLASPIEFDSYPHGAEYILSMRETLNAEIEKHLNK
ncbi:MAG: DUF4091 domain-containing protein [Oscillospiraceae bacterium]|nr:DUF4091 domain-containing protein [Oscillospiraceae bacterium]